MSSPLTLQISAALTMFVAAGFGLPIPWVALHLARNDELPTFMGLFPMYGGPIFGRVSQGTFTLALACFAAVCAVDLVAGCWLWSGSRDAAMLTIALLPVDVLFWYVFALPIPPLLALVRMALLAVGWASLT